MLFDLKECIAYHWKLFKEEFALGVKMGFVLDGDALVYLEARIASSTTFNAGELDPIALRAEESHLRDRYGHGPEMWNEVDIPASAELQERFILDPISHPNGTLLYFHGGGWVMGEPADYLAVCRAIAQESGWRVVVADYRKAPEHPFPAAFQDSVNAMLETFDEKTTHFLDAPVVVGGDSAGGNLAAAVSVEASRRSGRALAAQLLITPVLDTDLETVSYLDESRQLTLTRELMGWFLDQYVPDYLERDDWRVSPMMAPDFSAYPSTLFISVCSDVLHDEGQRFIKTLRGAGVDVAHKEFEGQMHGFFQLYNVMPAVNDAVSWIAQELRKLSESRTNVT